MPSLLPAVPVTDRLRIALSLGCCGLLLWARFWGWDLSGAASFVAEGSFWIIAASIVFLVFSLLRVFWPDRAELRFRDHFPGLMVAVASCLFIVFSQPWFLKVEFDESTHLLGSIGLAEDASAVLPMAIHDLGGGLFQYEGFTVAHRLPLLSWLVSLPVSLGVSPLTAVFGVNVALGFIGVFLVWLAGLRLGARNGGLVAAVALGFHPLWSENVSSGGYDILNSCLLLGFLFSAFLWWQRPDGPRLDLLVSVTVLLGLARYESILYTLPAAFLILFVWRREGRAVITWPAALSPLLLAPALAVNLASLSSLGSGVPEGVRPFGPEHWWGNALGLCRHFLGAVADSSPLLLLAALAAAVLLWKRRLESVDRSLLFVLLVFVAFCSMVYGTVVMTCYWSNPTDPLAVRFTLPLWICLCLIAALLGRHRLSLWLTPVLVLGGVAASLLNGARAPERFSVGQAWRGCDSWRLPPEVLLVAPSNNRLILRLQPSVMLSKMGKPDALLNLLDAKVYREAWVLDFNRKTPLPSGWIFSPLDPDACGIPSASFSLRRVEGFTFPDGRTRLANPGSRLRPSGVSSASWSLGWIRKL